MSNRRGKLGRAALVAGIPPVVVESTPAPCTPPRHYWPADFEYGDTCNCGEFYLLRHEDGAIVMEQTP